MGFSRQLSPPSPLDGDTLAATLAGLGMAFSSVPLLHQNIEDAVLAASIAGMEQDDYRVLGVTVVWLDVHRARLNADRLIRVVRLLPQARTRAFWQAMAQRWGDDRRWQRLSTDAGARTDLLRSGTAFHLRRHGEDPRFAGTGLIVPRGTLRDRAQDALPPEQVAKLHRPYHYRVLMGPGYRADLWAALEADPTLSASELARRTYASFATAWQVKRDFATLVA